MRTTRIITHFLPFAASLLLLTSASSSLNAQETQTAAMPGSIVAELKAEIEKVSPVIKGKWTQSWIAKAGELPPVKPFLIKAGKREVTVDESLFYSGRYGTPLAYARAFDLAEGLGFSLAEGGKVFDFGYGSIGHLRMLALSGMSVTAVDVDPLLLEMYKDASGPLGKGSVQLLNGKFPAEAALVEKAGEGYDLFISKNTLKRGYIHPAREPASPKHVIDLGVTDEVYLAQVAKMLKPGGFFVMYNLCPPKAPADKPYIPWADGECPFTKEQLAAAGFEVLAYDVVDDAPARELGKCLGWHQTGMKLDTDLFAWYTIAKRK
jgi:SAM-dependent methyltransferase